MKTILQIEYRHSTLQLQEEILQGLGHPITSVLGNRAARRLDLDDSIGVVVIGHGAPWRQRLELIEYFRATLPHVPIVALLRRTDVPFQNSTHKLLRGQPCRVGENCGQRIDEGSMIIPANRSSAVPRCR